LLMKTHPDLAARNRTWTRTRLAPLLFLCLAPACDHRNSDAGSDANVQKSVPRASARTEAPLPGKPWTGAAIAHGGQLSAPKRASGCRAAVDAALRALESGADPVDAAVAGVVVMEDDPHFNAGTGSRVRLDGTTVQMDAAVMASTGRFGAVAAIES